MQSTNTATTKVTQRATTAEQKKQWIFVCQLNDGRYIVGSATNPSRRIASINSGMNKAVPTPLSIYRIVGIKEQTESRNLMSVTAKFCERLGNDRVLAL